MESTERILRRSIMTDSLHACRRVFFHMSEDPTVYRGLLLLYWLFDLIQMLAFPLNMSPHLMWAKNDVMKSIMSVLSPIMIIPTTAEEGAVDAFRISAESLYFATVAFLFLMWGGFVWAAYEHILPPISALRAAMAGKIVSASGRAGASSGGVGSSGGSTNSGGGSSSAADRDRNNLLALNAASASEVMEANDGLRIPAWFLRFVRTLAMVGLHAFFIPITTTLASPFNCHDKEMWPLSTGEYECFKASHGGFFAASVLLLPCWIMWNLIIASCVINRVPDLTGKRNILCVSHGRVTAGVIILKTILSVIFILSFTVNLWAYSVIMFGAGIVYCVVYWSFLPYFHQWLNQVQMSIGSILIAAAGGHLLAAAIGEPEHDAGVTAFLILLVPAIYVGYSLGAMRFRAFAKHTELLSPFTVELRMRYMLHELIATLGHAHDAAAALSRTNRSESLYGSGNKSNRGESTSATALTIASPSMSFSGGGQRKGGGHHRRDSANEEEAFLRHKDSDAVVAQALVSIESLFMEAVGVFASSAILQLFYAHFLGTYRHNSHLEREYLSLADARADQMSIDVRFFVYQRRMELRIQELAIGTQVMTVERRMQYERLLDLSSTQVTEVRNLVLTYWSELANKHPDLQRVQNIGVTITIAIADAHDTFKELLDLAPQSASVMRAYADFLLELANDPTRAHELLTDAEQIEDEQSKAHSLHVDVDIAFGAIANDFDLSAESLAWIKVSSEPSRMGTIVDANSSLLKMWGYNRRELLGREMSFLVPEPISTVHSRILERYQSTGQERVVNQSRILFGLHRSGHIFPLKINIRPAEDMFTAVFEEIVCPLGFMFFIGEEHGWKVMAACKASMASLHFDVSQMKAGSVSMKRYVADPHVLLDSLAAADDAAPTQIGNMRVAARVQQVPIPFLSTPVYIFRYRILGYNAQMKYSASIANGSMSMQQGGNNNAAAGSGEYDDDKDDDDDEGGDAQSDVALSDRDDDDDDEYNNYNNNVVSNGKNTTTKGQKSTTKNTPSSSYKAGKFTIRSTPSNHTSNNHHTSGRKIASGAENAGLPTISLVFPPGHPGIGAAGGGDISTCPVMGNGNNSSTSMAGGAGGRRSSDNNAPTTDNTSSMHLPGQADTRSPQKGHTGMSDVDIPNTRGLRSTTANALDEMLFPVNSGSSSSSSSSSALATASGLAAAASNPGTDALGTTSASSAHVGSNSLYVVNNESGGSLSPSGSILRTQIGGKRESRLTMRVNFNGGNAPTSAITTVPNASNAANFAGGGALEQHELNSAMSTRQSEARLLMGREDSGVLFVSGNDLLQPVPGATGTNGIPMTGKSNSHAKMGRAGSVAKSTATSESSVTDILRKGVTARGAKLERSLISLKRAIVGVFLIIAVLNIISLVVTSTLFGDMKHNLDLVSMNGDRALYMSRSVGHTQALVLSAENKLNILEGTTYIQNRLKTWGSKFEALHRDLYLAVDGSLPEELTLYTDLVVNISDLVPGSYVDITHWRDTTRRIGLANAGLELISRLELVNALSPANMTRDKPPISYVLNNGPSTLLDALNQSLMYADQRSKGHVDNVEIANLSVMAAAESILLFIMAAIMVPAVNSVSHAKQRIFDTFLDVPVNIIRALRNRVQKKIDAISRSENENDQGIEVDNVVVIDDPESGRESGAEGSGYEGVGASRGYPGKVPSGAASDSSGDSSLNHALSAYQAKLRAQGVAFSTTLEHTDEDFEEEKTSCCRSVKCCRSRGRSSNGHHQHHGSSSNQGSASGVSSSSAAAVMETRKRRRRRYRNTSSSRAILLLGMVWPLLCYVAYFAALYAWRLTISQTVRYTKSEILWTKQAQFYVGMIAIHLRDAYGYCDPAHVHDALTKTEEVEETLEYLQNGLMYGAPELMLRPGIHVSDELYHFAMVNGCVENGGNFYTMDQCTRTFYNGIFGKGFMRGFREFSHIVRELALQQRAILAADPTLATLCDPASALNTQAMEFIDQMRWRYLAAGFSEFARIRYEQANSMFDWFQMTNVIITVGTILALQVFYSNLYSRMISRMDKEIKNVRLLLLLFPDEVSKQVPAIINAGKELSSDAASVSSGSSG